MKKRNNKENQYSFILEKLVLTDNLRKPDFEPPRLKIKNFSDDLEKKTSDDIPHSSLIDRINELVSKGHVIELDSGKRTPSKKIIFEYSITFLGFLNLISSRKTKFSNTDVDWMSFYLPKITDNFETLEKIFSKRQLVDTLIHVFTNVHISTGEYLKNGESNMAENTYVTSSEMLKCKKILKIFSIEIDLELLHDKIQIRKRYSLSDKEINNFQIAEVELKFSELVTASFFHQMYIRCKQREIYSDFSIDGIFVLSKIIKNWLNLKEIWLELLIEIKNELKKRQNEELESLTDMKKL